MAMRAELAADDEGEEEPELPVMQKVAILFVALGQETCGEVMKFLSDYEIEEITGAVANLKSISVELQDKVLEEFEQHLLAGEWVSQGGLDFARAALERAVGPSKAQGRLAISDHPPVIGTARPTIMPYVVPGVSPTSSSLTSQSDSVDIVNTDGSTRHIRVLPGL